MPLGAVGWAAVGSAAIGAIGSNRAASKAAKASNKALAGSDPFGKWREQYGQDLAKLMNDPSSIQQNPAYKFIYDQGLQAVQRSTGSRGLTGSGNALIELQQYGQGSASTFLENERRFLAELAGAGIGPNTGAGVAAAQAGYERSGEVWSQLGYGVGKGIEAYGRNQGGGVDYFTDVTAKRMPEQNNVWGGLGGAGSF